MRLSWFAFILTLFAGLNTGIGSILAFFANKTTTKFLSISLGFSAGVMIYVSMIEIFSKANIILTTELGNNTGSWVTVAGFFSGMLLIAIIDRLIPSEKNPHEIKNSESINNNNNSNSNSKNSKPQLLRIGTFTALAVAIHNFPEGLATFVSAIRQSSIAVPITVAIAIHNIPEGIAVSVPIYYAAGSKKKRLYILFYQV